MQYKQAKRKWVNSTLNDPKSVDTPLNQRTNQQPLWARVCRGAMLITENF